jgi:hypothetical protein
MYTSWVVTCVRYLLTRGRRLHRPCSGVPGGPSDVDAEPSLVSRPSPSWHRSISTEIYLCHACSCQELLRTETAGQEFAGSQDDEEDAEYGTTEVRFPLRFRSLIIMIRTEYETSRNVGESQPLTWFLS